MSTTEMLHDAALSYVMSGKAPDAKRRLDLVCEALFQEVAADAERDRCGRMETMEERPRNPLQ